jgi:hypothetical protein
MFEPVAMASGEDWIMRPVLEGLCKYESLIDGSLDLFDIARMNEALDVKQENERRAAEALAAKEK